MLVNLGATYNFVTWDLVTALEIQREMTAPLSVALADVLTVCTASTTPL